MICDLDLLGLRIFPIGPSHYQRSMRRRLHGSEQHLSGVTLRSVRADDTVRLLRTVNLRVSDRRRCAKIR